MNMYYPASFQTPLFPQNIIIWLSIWIFRVFVGKYWALAIFVSRVHVEAKFTASRRFKYLKIVSKLSSFNLSNMKSLLPFIFSFSFAFPRQLVAPVAAVAMKFLFLDFLFFLSCLEDVSGLLTWKCSWNRVFMARREQMCWRYLLPMHQLKAWMLQLEHLLASRSFGMQSRTIRTAVARAANFRPSSHCQLWTTNGFGWFDVAVYTIEVWSIFWLWHYDFTIVFTQPVLIFNCVLLLAKKKLIF